MRTALGRSEWSPSSAVLRVAFPRAETRLRNLTIDQPAEILLVFAQVGALGVGGFQTDVRPSNFLSVPRSC